jgi:hypothetical protein
MTDLAKLSLLVGGVIGIFQALVVFRPCWMAEQLKRFPRSRILGVALAALALLWSGWLLYRMPMETLDRYKPWLWVLTPLSIYLVTRYMDELLAPRALGGLLALAPVPLLDAARFHPSPWRLVITVTAYVLVIKGMALMLSPYLFRKATAVAFGTPARARLSGVAGLLFAAVLLGLGLRVY